MDFFARQDAARRQSRWLVVTYFIAVLCVIGGIDLVALVLTANVNDGEGAVVEPGAVVVACTLLTAGLILVATTYKILTLRGGGGVVARDMGGVRVDPSTRDPLRRRLVNVVEEMAIASGVPAPEIYVLESETAINAFSAGHSPSDAAVAVTAGMLKRLNREQLQAVIAHEFSHVLNGDMRLSIRLMGLNFGLLVLMLAGRLMLNASGGNRKGKGGGLLFVALAIMILGYLGQVFGRLLQAMISRRREALADASAVQFTRNPEGLKAALLRAAAQRVSPRLQAAEAEEVAHMLFLSSGRRLFATHPATIDRLRELEPGYTEERMRNEIVSLQKRWDQEEADNATAVEPRGGTRAVKDLAGGSGLAGVLSAAAVAAGITGSVADPQPEHVRRAQALRESLPEALQDIAGSATRSRALILALLLSSDTVVRERQFEMLNAAPGGNALAADVQAESPVAQVLEPEQRLPAVLQLFPALRQLVLDERQQLQVMLMKLAAADRRIDVFEFSLGKLVVTALGEAMRPRAPHGSAALDQRLAPLGLLFAVLARHGATDDGAAKQAYAAGMGKLLGSRWPDYDCPIVWAPALSQALDALRELQPAAKELLIEAMVATIGHDGRVSVEEAELLRTVCGVLQCPIPPLLAPGAAETPLAE